MDDYRTLKKQYDALGEKVAAARRAQLTSVIAEMQKTIEEFDIAPEDLYPNLKLGRRGTGETLPRRPPRKDRVMNYRNPATGEEWSGGPGRKPKWVLEIEARGESMDAYQIRQTP